MPLPSLEEEDLTPWLHHLLLTREVKKVNGVPEIESLARELSAASASGDRQARRALVNLGRTLALQPVSSALESVGSNDAWKLKAGALSGCASLVLGIGDDASVEHLHLLLPAIATCLQDVEQKVRVAALEALYNIGRIVRELLTPFAPMLLLAIFNTASDPDPEVSEALEMVDNLLKDIISASRTVEVKSITPVLIAGTMNRSGPSAQCAVRWVLALESVPRIGQELLEGHPEIIESLFELMGRQTDFAGLVSEALEEFLERSMISLSSGEAHFDIRRFLPVLFLQCRKKEAIRWHMVVRWLETIIMNGGEALMPVVAELVEVLIKLFQDAQIHGVLEVAMHAEESLAKLRDVFQQSIGGGYDWPRHSQEKLLGVVIAGLESEADTFRFMVMSWLKLVLDFRPDCPFQQPRVFACLLRGLRDNDEAATLSLKIAFHIFVSRSDPSAREAMLQELLQHFKSNRDLLERRSQLSIKMLCESMGAVEAFEAISHLLAADDDPEFVELIVEKLNMLMLKAPELHVLRSILPRIGSKKPQSGEKAVFDTLYPSWSYNTVAVLSLCLISQAYDLALGIVNIMVKFMEHRTCQGLYKKNAIVAERMDHLVRLFDRPVFAAMRVHLLEPDSYPALHQCLNAILSLMPQSKAFRLLRRRVKTTPMHLFLELDRYINEQEDSKDPISSGDKAAKKAKPSPSSTSSAQDDWLSADEVRRLEQVFVASQEKALQIEVARAASESSLHSVEPLTFDEVLSLLPSDRVSEQQQAASRLLEIMQFGSNNFAKVSSAHQSCMDHIICILKKHAWNVKSDPPPKGTVAALERDSVICLLHTVVTACCLLITGEEGFSNRKQLMQGAAIPILGMFVSKRTTDASQNRAKLLLESIRCITEMLRFQDSAHAVRMQCDFDGMIVQLTRGAQGLLSTGTDMDTVLISESKTCSDLLVSM